MIFAHIISQQPHTSMDASMRSHECGFMAHYLGFKILGTLLSMALDSGYKSKEKL